MRPKPAHLGRRYAEQFKDRAIVDAYRHRPEYPQEAIDALAGLLPPHNRHVLDLGCGTGQLARRLTAFADRVDAVDFSAAAIETARSEPGGDHPALHWHTGEAEAVPAGIAEADWGPFGLITFGESIHWMDWERLFPRLDRWLAQGGLIAITGRDTAYAPQWRGKLRALIAQYSTNRDYAPYNLMVELQSRGLFRLTGSLTVDPQEQRQPVDAFIESIHSRNGFSRDRMPDAIAEAFDSEVRELLAPYATDGEITFRSGSVVWWGVPGLPA